MIWKFLILTLNVCSYWMYDKMNDNNSYILDNFKLINRDEIIDFIKVHKGLLELLEKVYPLVKSYFPDYFYSLSYASDPEIIGLEDLMLCIHGEEKEFKNNRKKLHDLEREIDDLKVSNCKIKRLLLVEVLFWLSIGLIFLM